MNEFIKELKEKNIAKILEYESLKKYTTFKVGGIARLILIPTSIENLQELLLLIKKYKLKYKILGNGSNLVFSSKLYNNIIIKLDCLDKYDINPDGRVIVGASYSIIKLANETASYSLKGLEFASGIPGTIGGAIYQNAGAYNKSMSDIVESVTVLKDGKFINLLNDECNFSYRNSLFKNDCSYIIIKSILKLEKGNSNEIKNIIIDRRNKRISSQPLEYPSAGSVFRNPSSSQAWKLIDGCGLKGYKIGGASISKKHANFIINENNATGEDIYSLVKLIKLKVKEKYDIDLECEQEFINF